MDGTSPAERKPTQQEIDQVTKLLKDMNGVLKQTLTNFDLYAVNVPPSKMRAMHGYLEAHQKKLELLLKLYTAPKLLEAFERAKKEDPWLATAAAGDLLRFTLEALQSAGQASVALAAVAAAQAAPGQVAALAKVSEKLDKVLGAPAAAIGAISEAIRAFDALRKGDKEGYYRAAGSAAANATTVVLILTKTGSGAGPALVISLYVEGFLAVDRLGAILKEIREEKERRYISLMIKRADLVAGLARSMFANHDKFLELAGSSPAEAEFLWGVLHGEGRRLGANLFDLAKAIEIDGRENKTKERFPPQEIRRIYMETAVRDFLIFTGRKQFIQETLYRTAAYVALRLHELKVIKQGSIPHEMQFLKMKWRL